MRKPNSGMLEVDRESGLCVKSLNSHHVIMKHLKTDLKIIVSSESILKQHYGQHEFIDGRAVLTNELENVADVQIRTRIACGGLYRLKNRIAGDEINILDHLDLLFPKFESSIGLFTYQNGIQNDSGDFEKMGDLIIEKLPEQPLCIGLYNETEGVGHGFSKDFVRMWCEWEINYQPVLIMRQMLLGLAKIFSSIKWPEVYWAHIAHSEGGLIANEVLTHNGNYQLSRHNYTIGNFLRKHLITMTYGAVAPIPNIVKHAINTYSHRDVVLALANKYLDKVPQPEDDEELVYQAIDRKAKVPSLKAEYTEYVVALLKKEKGYDEKKYIQKYPHSSNKDNYTLTVVKSEIPDAKIPFGKKDHDFAGDTYQLALKNDIDFIRKKFIIYACR